MPTIYKHKPEILKSKSFLRDTIIVKIYSERAMVDRHRVYGILGRVIPHEQIRGLQRIPNGLWRIYTDTNEARELLLYEGNVTIREKEIPIYGINPGSMRHYNDNSIQVRVKHVPLSADDGQITRAITLKGCTVSNLYRQRLRYEGRLTNCETGDRILTVTNMEAHLPRTMIIGKYRVVVVYRVNQMTVKNAQSACKRVKTAQSAKTK